MNHQLISLLNTWYPERDHAQWVLGVVYKTEGPCYRKAGAMMLFDDLGQQLGLLSGGCLESDIQIHARKVMQSGESCLLCYDGSDEDDVSFQLGIGCGGTVHILLHPVTADNAYLHLDVLHTQLNARASGQYVLSIPGQGNTVCSDYREQHPPEITSTRIIRYNDRDCLTLPIVPEPHLLVAGGGVDARPVVAMARQLGWAVTLWDPRPANARREFFDPSATILNAPSEALKQYAQQQRVDVALVMSHSVSLDAQALLQLNGSGVTFIGLLGPISRKHTVLEQAGLSQEDLVQPVSGPAGLDIGGELPESIALSMLSQCHAVLHGKSTVRADEHGV